MNTYGLGGKVALVTGGASGIGRACAHTLARSGADVAIWDRDEEGISRVLGELEAYGYRTHGTAVDVGDPTRSTTRCPSSSARSGTWTSPSATRASAAPRPPAPTTPTRTGTR